MINKERPFLDPIKLKNLNEGETYRIISNLATNPTAMVRCEVTNCRTGEFVVGMEVFPHFENEENERDAHIQQLRMMMTRAPELLDVSGDIDAITTIRNGTPQPANFILPVEVNSE